MSDTYYCAITGKPFEADWSVRCECTTCMPLDSPDPPMTRCPMCAVKGQVNCPEHRTAAAHAGPLDFEKCEKETEAPICANLDYPVREVLQRQARAYAYAAVKAERARIAMALIECEDIHGRGKAERGAGCDYCAGWLDAADFVTTSGEARDDHR